MSRPTGRPRAGLLRRRVFICPRLSPSGPLPLMSGSVQCHRACPMRLAPLPLATSEGYPVERELRHDKLSGSATSNRSARRCVTLEKAGPNNRSVSSTPRSGAARLELGAETARRGQLDPEERAAGGGALRSGPWKSKPFRRVNRHRLRRELHFSSSPSATRISRTRKPSSG